MNIATSRHRYSRRALTAELTRASAGLILTLGPLFLENLLFFLQVILGFLALIFFVFGLRSLARRVVTIKICNQGIHAQGAFNKSINWQELNELRLFYFSTRRDREKGWMQLRLGSGKTRIQLDDYLEGFDHIVYTTVRAAKEHNVQFDLATLENLSALKIDPLMSREAKYSK